MKARRYIQIDSKKSFDSITDYSDIRTLSHCMQYTQILSVGAVLAVSLDDLNRSLSLNILHNVVVRGSETSG